MRASTLRRTTARASAVILVFVLASLGLAAPAHAAEVIQVSDDGVTFGPTYPGVLFSGIAKIVPGDTQSQVFYVRNDGPDDGYLRITLRNVTGEPTFAAALDVATSSPGHTGAPATLAKASPCWVLNEGIFLAARSTLTVTATLGFASSSGNPTQSALANFEVNVSLTDTAVALPPTDCGGSGTVIPGVVPRPGALSYTGSDVPVMLIIVTAFIMGAGLFLVVAARRRKRESDEKPLGE